MKIDNECSLPWSKDVDTTETPIIGILSQTFDFDTSPYPELTDKSSYIMGAYVRFMQSAGARVVPIYYDESDEDTLEKMGKISGVLMPGGGGDYVAKGQFISDQARKMNDEGSFFPVWGTCLGFERLAIYTASDQDNVLEKYGAHSISMELEFTENPMSSNMYCSMPSDQINSLETGNFTYNSHSYSVSPEKMKSDDSLRDFWTVTATTKDADGRDFVASMEGRDYPFMATQFHPEKVT